MDHAQTASVPATTWLPTTPTCPTLANTATYNAYPTCGASTCNSGCTLSNGACVVSGGSGLPVDALNLPTAPVGGFKVLINPLTGSGLSATTTNSSNVILSLIVGDNVKNMAISNFPDFIGAGQELYQATKQWDICEGRTTCLGGEYTVYVKFYTKYGQPSETISASINLDSRFRGNDGSGITTQQQKLVLIAQIKKQLISLITQLIQLLTAKVGEMR